MKKVRFLRPGYFVWVLAPLALFASGGLGDPHVIWSYEWRALGTNARQDWSQRYYTRCIYIGRAGTLIEYPDNGKCGWIRFAPARGAAR